MGEHDTHSSIDGELRQRFIRHLLDDVNAFEQMINAGKIESGIVRIGAEQEFCLVNQNWRPTKDSTAILKAIDDVHFTTELAKYNLEINLDPFELKGDAFSKVEKQLSGLLNKAKAIAEKHENHLVLSGILPSISTHEIGLNYMTEHARYFALNDMLRTIRGDDFHLQLSGVDELSIRHKSIMLEACNTSFQMHLQIDPDDFVNSYNWSQAISGPVLGLCVNSPLLLGRELWQETRIALFQQSIDTRGVSNALKNQLPRVSFGDSWAEGSIVDLFTNEIARHRIILSKDISENSLQELKNNRVPKLAALCLHNGTIYRWNRPCYGVGGGKAHVRIENRYIPAGPSVLDELANFAFWVGLMMGRPPEYNQVQEKMDFKQAKSNFTKAARYGSETIMNWMGREIPLKDLVLKELLPLARAGLKKARIDEVDIDRLLNVIEQRAKGRTPAQWMLHSYRHLQKEMKQDDALIALTKGIYDNQQSQKAQHTWDLLEQPLKIHSHASKVGHVMTSRLFTAFLDDTAELTLQVMAWKNIHHLPIVDHNERLKGLLTWTHIQNFKASQDSKDHLISVADIMEKSLFTAETSTPIKEAIALMKKEEIGCLPVLQKKHLVGIVTIKDLLEFDND